MALLPLAVQIHEEHLSLVSQLDKAKQSAQEFFATFAAELRQPHYGDGAKIFCQAMLIRAQEAGLYVAPKEVAQ